MTIWVGDWSDKEKKKKPKETDDINGQALRDVTTDENVEDDEIQQEEEEFVTQHESGGDTNIK